MKWHIWFILLFISNTTTVSAQTNQDQQSLPSWVYAIDNPQVNYYQAIRDFDNYWKGKSKPELDDREQEEDKQHRQLEKQLRKMNAVQHEQYNLMAYHYKRFLDWQHEVKPYVQEDGRILTADERVNLWKQQQQSKSSSR
jgi:hypothetical protein